MRKRSSARFLPCGKSRRLPLKTDEGRKVYAYNCGFSWRDLDVYVPDHICALYGFREMTTIDHFRDFDEQLVDEDWDED